MNSLHRLGQSCFNVTVKVKNVAVQMGEVPRLLVVDLSDVSVAVRHKPHINSEEKSQDAQKILNIRGCVHVPISLVARSKAWVSGIVGSNPT
jgi:hypothetical protein